MDVWVDVPDDVDVWLDVEEAEDLRSEQGDYRVYKFCASMMG